MIWASSSADKLIPKRLSPALGRGEKFKSSLFPCHLAYRKAFGRHILGNAGTQAGRLLRKLQALVFGPAQDCGNAPVQERFELPFTFNPRLSVLQAMVATLAVFFRIVLGCGLLAIWGRYTLMAWANVEHPFLRFVALVSLFSAFLVALAVVMLAISVLTRVFVAPKTNRVEST